jgi:hypothetical protein
MAQGSIEHARRVFAKKETDLTTLEKRTEEKTGSVGAIAVLGRRSATARLTYPPKAFCEPKRCTRAAGLAAGFAI